MEIIGSAILAIAQSILFYGNKIGISILIFTILSEILIFYIINKNKKIRNKNGFLLLIPILLLSSTYLIFANKIFYIINIFVIIILNILMYAIVINKKGYLEDYIYNSISLVKNTILGLKDGVEHTKNETKEHIKIKKSNKNPNMKKIMFSILTVIVVVSIVIGLLASADSVFASIFTNLAKLVLDNINIISIINLVIRIAIIILTYMLILSFVIKLKKEYFRQERKIKSYNNRYAFTIKLLLIALNIVYLIFCFIQIESLFTKNNQSENFDYANYARTGFFQLMFVSFINFVVILMSNKFNENKETSIKILNLFLVIFTIIIAISSMYRMHMYQLEYGLTYLRMFVYIILITEIIMFIPIIIYIFNEKFDFLKYVFIICLFIYCGINFMQMENLIIDYNLNKKAKTNPIDYDYINKIASADSYELLENELEKSDLNILNKFNLKLKLLQIVNDSQNMKWQEFNISKWKINEKNIDTKKLEDELEEISDEAEKERLRLMQIEEEKAQKEREVEIERKLAERKLNISEDSAYCVYKNIISEDEAYVVEVTAYATGTEQWTIGKITDNGTKYTKMNTFSIAPTSKIEFFENGLGFLEEADSIYCANSKLLITRDSGKTFEKIDFPEGKFTLSNPKGKYWDECYDYFYLPTREDDGSLTVQVSGGYEGGYNNGKTRAKYVSYDNGYTWEFAGEFWKE